MNKASKLSHTSNETSNKASIFYWTWTCFLYLCVQVLLLLSLKQIGRLWLNEGKKSENNEPKLILESDILLLLGQAIFIHRSFLATPANIFTHETNRLIQCEGAKPRLVHWIQIKCQPIQLQAQEIFQQNVKWVGNKNKQISSTKVQAVCGRKINTFERCKRRKSPEKNVRNISMNKYVVFLDDALDFYEFVLLPLKKTYFDRMHGGNLMNQYHKVWSD